MHHPSIRRHPRARCLLSVVLAVAFACTLVSTILAVPPVVGALALPGAEVQALVPAPGASGVITQSQSTVVRPWWFGEAVALSGDTALVGAPLHDVGTNVKQGAVYVFVRSAGIWIQQAVLTVSSGSAGDRFGWAVALDGDTALVGAPGREVDGNADEGVAYVFTRSGTNWRRAAVLTAQDGAAADAFGTSVALSGDAAIVGSHGHDVGAVADQGAAYVYVRTFEGWLPEAELTAADGIAGDGFGYSVALSGDTALVGMTLPENAVVKDPAKTGAAYVFVRSGNWQQQAKLRPSDDAGHDGFGAAVALSGDTAVIGAPYHSGATSAEELGGAAYVFTRSGGVWTQQGDALFQGRERDASGLSVAVDGNTIVAGTFGKTYGSSAKAYVRSAGNWSEDGYLFRSGGGGELVLALGSDTALVGYPSLYDQSSGVDGVATFLQRSDGEWAVVSQVSADAAPPTTSITLSPAANDAGWNRNRVKVTLDATDGRSAIARMEWRAEGSAKWIKYSSPFPVSTNGITKWEYRSRDQAGNIESAKTLRLKIDSKKPTVRMYPASVRRGRKVALKFKVNDPLPSCRRATVALQVFKGRVPMALVKAGTRPCNTVQKRVWRCTLPRGAYKIVAYATDRAGNTQRRIGRAVLIVR